MNKVREKERHINKVLQQRKKKRTEKEIERVEIKGNGETRKITCTLETATETEKQTDRQ